MRNKMLSPKEFIEDAIQKIKDQIGDEKAIIALSGGSVILLQIRFTWQEQENCIWLVRLSQLSISQMMLRAFLCMPSITAVA